MKNKIFSFIAKMTAVLMALSSLLQISPVRAAQITSAKDTLTRIAASTNADHTVLFTLPATFDFDSTGTTDMLRVDFPHSSAFTQTGTWVTGDFTFNDGTARTVEAVAQGGGIVDCTVAAGTNNVCVAIDTTSHIFSIKPSSTYTASATGATVTFTIDGTATDGELINPSVASSYAVVIAECDNVASCTSAFTSTHSTTIGVGIADSDQVTVSATVDPSLTFDIDTATTDTEVAVGAGYAVAFGILAPGTVKSSGSTVNSVYLDLATNAAVGAVITVRNANGANGLASTSVPADDIDSATGTMASGVENYGLCVASNTTSSGTFNDVAPYDGATCAANGVVNIVGGLLATATNILNSNSLPITGGRAQVLVNANAIGTTAAHNDYTDTLTFVATGTF